MPWNIYDTGRLLQAVQGINEAPSFIKDRYFPSSDADVFPTEKVLAEYRDGDRRLAPFVINGSSGMAVARQGQRMEEYEPPIIMPERPITLDDITKRGFGEALYGADITPEQRANLLAIRDMDELINMIVRREEQMAAETLLTNGCKMYAYSDMMEPTLANEVRFYSGDRNPAVAAITTDWDEAEAHILDDIAQMVRRLTREGLPATDLLVAPDVSDAIIKNKEIQDLLHNRRFELGSVNPSLMPPEDSGAAITCQLNVNGHMINVISYDKVYTDDKGEVKQYMPEGTVVLSAPGAGRTLYGMVSQVENDGQFHSYPGRRVPKFTADPKHNVRTIAVSSRPLMIPNDVNPWIFAQAITQN